MLVIGIAAAASGPHGGQGVALPAQLLLEVTAPPVQQRLKMGEVLRREPGLRFGHGQETVTLTECNPVAPSGTTSATVLVCTRPLASVARTRMLWDPFVAFHS